MSKQEVSGKGMPDKGTTTVECWVESRGHAGELCTGVGSKGGEAAAGSARNKLWAALTVKRAPCFHSELKPLVTSPCMSSPSHGVISSLRGPGSEPPCPMICPVRPQPPGHESSQAVARGQGWGKKGTLNGPHSHKAGASAPMPPFGASSLGGGQPDSLGLHGSNGFWKQLYLGRKHFFVPWVI